MVNVQLCAKREKVYDNFSINIMLFKNNVFLEVFKIYIKLSS